MPHPWLTGTIREDEAEDRERVEAPRAEDRKVYPRSFAAMIGMLGHMQRQLPYEKMRQSTNVVDRSRAQPPPPSLADLVAGQFVPNAEYERRMQLSVPPMDPLAVGAGILDIAPKGRRGFAEGGHFTVPNPDDPFERAARRTGRRGRREEGRVSQIIDALAPALVKEGRRVATIPQRMVEASIEAQETGDLEPLRRAGGELTGTGVETMFGPKGSRSAASARFIGSFNKSQQTIGKELDDLLPKDWIVKPGSGLSSNVTIYDNKDKFIGVAAKVPGTGKYLFSTQSASHWGETAEQAFSKMQAQGAVASAKLIGGIKHSGEMTKAEMKEWSAKVNESLNTKITFADIVEHAKKNPIPSQRTPRAEKDLADLPPILPEAELEAARLAGGYTTPAYRGRYGGGPGRRDPGERTEPIFSAANPDLAGLYAGVPPDALPTRPPYLMGNQLQPMYLDTRNYLVFDAGGAHWGSAQNKAFPIARQEGRSGVVMHNVLDEPSGNYSAAENILKAPQTVYITFDPKTRKSKFARQFDPESRDLLKARLIGADPTLAGIAGLDPGDYEGRR